jgi:hypothetical protein
MEICASEHIKADCSNSEVVSSISLGTGMDVRKPTLLSIKPICLLVTSITVISSQ